MYISGAPRAASHQPVNNKGLVQRLRIFVSRKLILIVKKIQRTKKPNSLNDYKVDGFLGVLQNKQRIYVMALY